MAKKKLHQWEPFGIISEDITYTEGSIFRSVNCMECVKCGLRKGKIIYKGFGTTAYYENGNIHSLSTLPFECISYDRLNTPYQIEKIAKRNGVKPKRINKEFLLEEEFYV